MSKAYMDNVILEQRINDVLAPFEIVYMIWLILTLLFNFQLFMGSLLVQFIILAVYSIASLVIDSRKTPL